MRLARAVLRFTHGSAQFVRFSQQLGEMRKKHTRTALRLTVFGRMLAQLDIGADAEAEADLVKAPPVSLGEGCHMLKILVLICPMSLDHAACNPDTALDIVRSMRVSTPQQCGFMGQAIIAPTALVPDPTKQYVKVMCVHVPGETIALAKP